MEIKVIFTNPRNTENDWVEKKFYEVRDCGLVKDVNTQINPETNCKELSGRK